MIITDKSDNNMNFKIITKIGCLLLVSLIATSFRFAGTLKGTWQYCGDVFNGKTEGATAEYSLQRKYSTNHFESFLLESGEKPRKYEEGSYTLNADTCLETQTYSAQESTLVGIPIHYIYTIRNDTLTLNGTLPNGSKVQEYWKKVN